LPVGAAAMLGAAEDKTPKQAVQLAANAAEERLLSRFPPPQK